MGWLRGPVFETPCRVVVEQSPDFFHAHLELEGDLRLEAGDRVQLHGGPVAVPFGGSVTVARTATVERAGPLLRALTRIKAHLELSELYEVSFTSGRL